jgi:hypothetical protein
MESVRPHKFKLGDFFYIWGVAFGKESLGALHKQGDKQLYVYVNGKSVADPPNYVLKEGDNISIGYGAVDSFPHEPDKSILKTVTGGNAPQGMCGESGDGSGGTSCVNPSAGGGSASGGSQPSTDPSAGK